MPDIPTLSRVLAACGFDLHLELAPHDDHDEALVAASLELTPAQRARRNRNVTRASATARRRTAPAGADGP